MKEIKDKNILLLGDFNVVRHEESDATRRTSAATLPSTFQLIEELTCT